MKKFAAFLSALALLTSTAATPLFAEVVTTDRTDDFSVDSATTYTVNEGGSYTFSGVISGTGNITKDGVGALTLSGDNSNTGALTINGGTLNMNNYGKYGSLNIISGTVNINKGYASNTSIAIPQNATVTVGSPTTTATLNLNAQYSLDQHTTFTIYKGSTVNLNHSGPQNFAWGGNGIIFEGGGTISGKHWQQGVLYNATVNGANAVVTINVSTLNPYASQNVNVVDATSVMNVKGNTSRGNADTGLTKNGAGRLSFVGSTNHNLGINVNEGTLAISGYAWTTPSLFTVKSGATLELGTSASISNLSLSGTLDALDSINVTGTMEVPANSTGTFQVANGKTSTVQGAFSGSGTLNKTGAGTLAFTAPQAFTGKVNVNAGTLTVAANETWNSSAAIAVASGANLNVGAGATLPGLTIAGTGTTFAGSAAVSAGLALSENATLNIPAGQNVTVAGALSGPGKMTKTGTGALNFTGSGTATAGGILVSAGTLSFSGSENLTLNSQYGSSSTLLISGPTANAATLNVSGNASVTVTNGWLTLGLNAGETGTMNVSGGTVTVSNALVVGEKGDGVLNISGGTLKLTTNSLWGANNIGTGTVTISGSGRLEVPSANLSVRGDHVINVEGGTFQVTTLNVIDSILNTNPHSTLNIKSGTVSAQTVNFTLMNDSSSGTGTVNLLGGTFTVSGNVQHSKTAAVAEINFGQGTYAQTGNGTWAGTLGINFNGRNTSSTADVAGGKTTIDVASGKTLTIPGVLSGVGGFQKTNTGTLVISGSSTNSFSGGVDVLNGTLKLTGSNASALGTGAVVVGDGSAGQNAVLDLTGFTGASLKAQSLEVGSNGTVELKLTQAGEGFNSVLLDFDSAALGGTLNLQFDPGTVLNEGPIVKIFPDSTTFEGNFASILGGDAVPYGYALTFMPENQTVFLSQVPEPSAWLLLLLGVGLCGAFQRRRAGKLNP